MFQSQRTLSLAVAVLIVWSYSAAANDETKKKSSHTIVMDVDDMIVPKWDHWRRFEGVCKCKVIESQSADIKVGQQVNVVVAKGDTKDNAFFVHENADIRLEKGKRYEITLSEELPKGWDEIKEEFADARIGLTALISIKRPNKAEK